MMRSRLGSPAALLLALWTASPAAAATFRYASSGDLVTLDPHSANEALTNGMKDNVYEALVHRRYDLGVEPGLAERWTQPDATTWRFFLRRGVKFHDGSSFTADDVVFSLSRAKSRNSTMTEPVAAVKEVRKIDDYTIEYVTNGPSPTLLQELTLHYIMSRRWCEQNRTTEPVLGLDAETYATRHANGTGPFMVVERVPDTRTVLAAFPGWWGNAKKEHNLDRVEYRPIANAATRLAAFLSGELEVMYPVPLQDIARVQSTPGLRVLIGPEARVVFLGFDQWRDELMDMPGSGKNPFKDVRVRRAVYQAIDEDAIHKKVMRGVAVPAGLMVAKEVQGYDPKLGERYPYDPAASRRLLAEAGYPNGFPVTLDCPNDRYINDEAICQAVVSMLGKVGIRVTLNAMPKSKWMDKILRRQNNNTSFYLLGWTPTTYDAHNALLALMTMTGPSAGTFNCGRYSNPKVEELSAAARVEMDHAKRMALLSEALRVHKEDFGHVPLHQQMVVWAVRDGVEVKLHPGDLVGLRWVTMKDRTAVPVKATR